MKNVVLATITGLSLFFVAAQANAACRITKGSASTFTKKITINVGTVWVNQNAAVGTIFKSQSLNIPSKSHNLMCTGSSYRRAKLDKTAFSKTRWDRVFQTNVPGVGIRIRSTGTGGSGMGNGTLPYDFQLGAGKIIQFSGYPYIVDFFKTGDITEGSLVTGRYGSVWFDGIGIPSAEVYVTGNFKIRQPTCALGGDKNRTIPLNPVSRNNFNAVGSTLGEKAFNIDLNCASGNAGKVGLMFDFNAHPNNNAVIQNAATSAVKAQGVDLQLISDYQNTVTAITKGMKLALGNVEANKAQNFIIPMRALYSVRV